jgi:hypothetical protein
MVFCYQAESIPSLEENKFYKSRRDCVGEIRHDQDPPRQKVHVNDMEHV